jgi:Flp pilus assembly protein TadG
MKPQHRVADVLATIARLVGDRRGGVAIESAFVFPVAILLTIGSIEAARAVSAQASINQAAKETVRFASVRGTASGTTATESELEALAVDLVDLTYGTTSADVSWNPDNSPGGVVTVDIQTTFTPLALPFFESSYTFTSTASMTVVR